MSLSQRSVVAALLLIVPVVGRGWSGRHSFGHRGDLVFAASQARRVAAAGQRRPRRVPPESGARRERVRAGAVDGCVQAGCCPAARCSRSAVRRDHGGSAASRWRHRSWSSCSGSWRSSPVAWPGAGRSAEPASAPRGRHRCWPPRPGLPGDGAWGSDPFHDIFLLSSYAAWGRGSRPGSAHRLRARLVDLDGAGAVESQRLVAMRADASGATITSTAVNRSSVSQSSRRVSTRPVEDRRPDLARREVVEHHDAARLDQVGDRVDADRRSGVAGVEEEQRERALVAQRRPVGGEHLDLGVVVEDLLRPRRPASASSSAVRIRASPRTPERSHAVPTPQPVPNSAIVPPRVAASVASSRPVSLRQNDT